MKWRSRNVKLQRKVKTNPEEEYVTEEVKVVRERKFTQLGEFRSKFKELITDEDRENTFKEHWGMEEYNRRLACLSTLVITGEKISEKRKILWPWFKHEQIVF